MGDHAKLSPSSAHRWMRCPGSVRLSAGIESVDTAYSREGTFAHGIAAAALSSGRPAVEYVGSVGHGGEFTCDAKMAAHVQTYLDEIDVLALISPATPIVWVEQKVTLTPDVYGTADAVVLVGDVLHVFDLKYGAGKFVPVEGNEQLLIYAAAALRTLLEGGERAQVKKVVLHIVQPRRTDADDNAHRSCEVERPDLNEFAQVAMEAAAATKAPDAPLVPGDHCYFCPAKPTCPALREQALVVAQEVFKDGDLDHPVAPPAVETLPPEKVAQILKAGARLEDWLKGVRDYAAQLVWKGTPVPGYKLVAKLSNRKWTSEDAAVKLLGEHGVDAFEPAKVVSPAEAERRLGKSKKGLVAPLTDRVVTGASLVPDSDKRPALTQGEVFTDLTETEEP